MIALAHYIALEFAAKLVLCGILWIESDTKEG